MIGIVPPKFQDTHSDLQEVMYILNIFFVKFEISTSLEVVGSQYVFIWRIGHFI